MSDRVAVVMVVRDEPLERMTRALDALAAQRGVDAFPVFIAAPDVDPSAEPAALAHGAVREVVQVANPTGARCAGLNRAVAATDADVVVRVDARSCLRPDHVARCLARLGCDPDVGVVGGVQWPKLPLGHTGVVGRGAVRSLRNRWLLGNASYRRPGAEGAVDTVYLGAFRRAELVALGGFDERLEANEDFDLCARYRESGRTVWLERDLVVDYEPRVGTVELFEQYRAFGEAKVTYWRSTCSTPNSRQWLALGLTGAVFTTMLASASRPRRLVGLAVGGLGAVAAIDHVADPAERSLAVRACAWRASVATTGGWLCGIAMGTARSLG